MCLSVWLRGGTAAAGLVLYRLVYRVCPPFAHLQLTHMHTHVSCTPFRSSLQLTQTHAMPSAISRICQNDEEYMDNPDIIKANTVLEDRALPCNPKRKCYTARDALNMLKVSSYTRKDRHMTRDMQEKGMGGWNGDGGPCPISRDDHPHPSPTQTQAGNAQFLRDEVLPKQSSQRHVALHFGQKPHAVIIACSDSRVPPVSAWVDA